MISAILIYGQRSEVLVSRIYKDGLRRAITDAFRVQVISNSEIQTPLLTMGSTSFLHIRYNEMYVVAVTRHDVDAIAVFELLYKLCDVCNSQLGRFDEAACYRNISHIYEILDEIVDFGFPQNTESGLINVSGSLGGDASLNDNNHHNVGASGGNGISGAVSSLRRSLTSAKPSQSSNIHLPHGAGPSNGSGRGVSLSDSNGADVPWRRSDVKHRRNEIYLDVLEKLNMVFEPNGHVISASVDGVLKVKAHLSGLPHCQVDLDKISVLENSQFHACVDHARFHEEGIVQFLPPEGEFDLLRYRVTHGVKVPLNIQNDFEHGEFVVKIRCTLEPKRHLTNIAILVPLPPTSTSNSHKFKAGSGKVKYVGEKTAAEWKIARLSGQSEAKLRITADDIRYDSSGSGSLTGNGPIMAKFLINMYTCSTLHVESLQVVEDTKYSTLKWVRYLTESGDCEARTSHNNKHT